MTTTTASTAPGPSTAPASAPHALEAEPASGLVLRGVRREYGATRAVDDIDLHIPAGSLTVVVGPSGSGKSTLLRLIAGLEPPTRGELRLDGAPLRPLGHGERSVGMVFQDYALFPHMTVRDNLSFGLRMDARHAPRGTRPSRERIRARTDEVAEMLGLTPYLRRRPSQLSGGQRQRVALGRGIIRRPSMLLLDEPLSALDPQLRASARAEIQRLHREIGATLVMVTHDQHEALTMATHLVVMRQGGVEQSGGVEDVHAHPVNRFVAEFIGAPAMNIRDLGTGSIGWRPADGRILSADDPDPADDERELLVTGVVELTSFTGDGRELLCRGRERFTVIDRRPGSDLRAGDPIRIAVPAERLHRFDAEGRSR